MKISRQQAAHAETRGEVVKWQDAFGRCSAAYDQHNTAHAWKAAEQAALIERLREALIDASDDVGHGCCLVCGEYVAEHGHDEGCPMADDGDGE